MEIHRKIALVLCLFTIWHKCNSQEMDIGIGMGVIGDVYLEYPALNVNAIYEFRPNHAFFSLQTNPGVIIVDNEYIIGAFPLSMNFIIGNKFRVCPNIGGFYWTIRRGGWSAGMNLQYSINESFSVFMNSQYLRVYYKEYYPSHFGGGTYQTTSDPGLNLSIGVKYRIKKGST